MTGIEPVASALATPRSFHPELHPQGLTTDRKLRNLGSNQDRRVQNASCCPYTIPQSDGSVPP